MAAFEYQAIDQQGLSVKGIFESDTIKLARHQLRHQGLHLLTIHEVQNRERQRQSVGFNHALSFRQTTLITRQLAALLRSSLAIDEALSLIAKQMESTRSRRILLGLRSRILEGQSFALALQAYPSSFSAMYRATVAAGESSGKLDQVLEHLADYLSDKGQLHSKLQMAMIYPILLTLISLLVVIALLTYVVPEITSVFTKTEQALPAITVALINCSDFFKHHGLQCLLLLLMLAGLTQAILRYPGPQLTWHRFLLTAPLISRFSRGINAARFTRTLAILTNSGVELLEALKISSQVLANVALQQAVEHTALKVREGQSLHKALEQCGFFPPITIHLIASGEASGQLPRMLANAADDQERDMRTLTELSLSLFEPALILLMGLVVLLIVLAILLPIFEMNQLIR